MLIFIDVSKWDPLIAWKNYDWDGAFIKASEGLVEDKMFKVQYTAARGYTIRSPYHFFHPSIDIKSSVSKFLDILGNDPGELPASLDLEVDDGIPEVTAINALRWNEEYRRRTGKKAITYTSPGFADHIKLHRIPDFKEYPLWMATYPRDKIITNWTIAQRNEWILRTLKVPESLDIPDPIFPWNLLYWIQWTAKCPPEYVPGYPLGVKEAVDINFCPFEMKTIFTLFNITHIPKPEGENDMEERPVTLTADLIDGEQSNLRVGPGLTFGRIETLTGPLSIEGVGPKIPKDNYWWIEIIGEKKGFVALTTSYENVKIITTNPPTKKVVKNTTLFDDGSTVDTFPRT